MSLVIAKKKKRPKPSYTNSETHRCCPKVKSPLEIPVTQITFISTFSPKFFHQLLCLQPRDFSSGNSSENTLNVLEKFGIPG